MTFHKRLTLEQIDKLGYVMPSLAWMQNVPIQWKFHDRKNPCKWKISSAYSHYQRPSESNQKLFDRSKGQWVEACSRCFTEKGAWLPSVPENRVPLKSAFGVTTDIRSGITVIMATDATKAVLQYDAMYPGQDQVEVYELTSPKVFKQKVWAEV